METIGIGKYRLTTDSLQFIVSQMKTHRTGPLKGQRTEVELTFHPTLISAVQNIMKRKVLASKVSTMKELITEIKKQNKLIQSWFDLGEKEGMKIKRKVPKVSKKAPKGTGKKRKKKETLSTAEVKEK